MSHIDYEHSIALIEELWRRPLRLSSAVGLRRIETLLDGLGHPERAFRSVHIAGSSGKGSTTRLIGTILQESGFRTGFFHSPHLWEYTDRIAVNGADISREQWQEAFSQVWQVVTNMEAGKIPSYDLGRPAVFEVLFALAAQHFATLGVDWAAMEAGLGGRLDATNTLNSDAAVITNISLEHTQILGHTTREIAAEKAAIIKDGVPAVTAAQDADALNVIAERCRLTGSALTTIPADIRPVIHRQGLDGMDVALVASEKTFEARLRLLGEFQATNAATAAGAILALRDRGITIDEAAIARGLQQTRLPGRFEVISRRPLIVLDGAHSTAGAGALRLAINDLLASTPITLLFAVMGDKDIDAMARQLADCAQSVVVTRVPDSPRGADPEDVAALFREMAVPVRVVDNAEGALFEALASLESDAALVICGSLYLVGLARRLLTRIGVCQ